MCRVDTTDTADTCQPWNLVLEVWQGRDKQTNEKVAVKFEDSANVPHLSGSVAIHNLHKDSSGHALQLEHEQHVLKCSARDYQSEIRDKK